MENEKMIELLNRKVQREKSARRAAEELLEKKSHELYTAKKLVEKTLLMVQAQAENDTVLLTFKSYLDSILLDYSQRLLQEKPSKQLLTKLLEDLVKIEPIQAIYLSSTVVTQEQDIQIFCDKNKVVFSNFKNLQNNVEWSSDSTQLVVYLHQNTRQCGILQFVFSYTPNVEWHETIEKQCQLFAEMISAAFKQQQLLENALKEKLRAEKSEQATRDFVAMINHELRTPLNGLLGSADLMEDTEITEYQQILLSTIHQSGEMLRVIINDLLDFSKMSAGMLELKIDSFEPRLLFNMIEKIFFLQVEEKKLEFIINIDDAIPLRLQGDVDRIQQILVNLIGNAIKFTEKGSITLTTSWKESTLEFVVSDTGCGIPIDKQSSLFDPFVQVDNSSQRKFEGTGLGLSICKFLVKEMQGRLSVKSEEGEGCEFTVCIPLSSEYKKSEEIINAYIDFPIEQLSVLAVEDIKMNRVILKMMLAKLGVSPDFAENGLQALKYLEKNTVDIILMDCRMPVLDGFETTKRLREKGYSKPILALTAGTTSIEVEACINAGMDDTLNKPYKAEELELMLKVWGAQAVSLN